MGATQSCHEGRKIVAGSQPRLSVVSPNDQWSRSSFARPNQPCVRPAAPSRRRVFRAALAHFSEQYRFARHGVNCLSQTGQVRLDAPAIDRKPSVSACGQGRGGRQRRPGAVERRTVACKRRNEQRGSFNRAHTTPPSSRLRTGCDRAGARQRATTFPSNCAGVDRSPSRQRTAAIAHCGRALRRGHRRITRPGFDLGADRRCPRRRKPRGCPGSPTSG